MFLDFSLIELFLFYVISKRERRWGRMSNGEGRAACAVGGAVDISRRFHRCYGAMAAAGMSPIPFMRMQAEAGQQASEKAIERAGRGVGPEGG